MKNCKKLMNKAPLKNTRHKHIPQRLRSRRASYPSRGAAGKDLGQVTMTLTTLRTTATAMMKLMMLMMMVIVMIAVLMLMMMMRRMIDEFTVVR